jgi:hypothetical protein
VAEAAGDAERSVTYADRSGDAFQRMGNRTTHADALHQAGRRAEQMQAESQPDYPLLYSLRGFRYCDLLLAAPERAAWQAMMRTSFNGETLSRVVDRAAQTLKWVTEANLGLLALDHLTLGRAALYEAILDVGPVPTGQSTDHHGRSEPALRYPWESVEHDLAEARRLIEKHGYLRRTEELEDAEEALLPPG